ncbi:hypothetical protein [Bradyrhizobium sp. B120]|uniref:hypothetical protein n=1 Tax=Bradyrhizobium sp. B120 TaxID=3410088 RepID=UPI003B97D7CF
MAIAENAKSTGISFGSLGTEIGKGDASHAVRHAFHSDHYDSLTSAVHASANVFLRAPTRRHSPVMLIDVSGGEIAESGCACESSLAVMTLIGLGALMGVVPLIESFGRAPVRCRSDRRGHSRMPLEARGKGQLHQCIRVDTAVFFPAVILL